MRFVPLEVPDVIAVDPQVFGDARGFFMETWHAGKFAEAGLDVSFVQDNHSRSVRGVLRGLHYQIGDDGGLSVAQGKLLRVLEGEVFDVAVDLRRSSRSFGRVVEAVLSAENRRMLWIPPGFAHGFYVISATAEIAYKCTTFYAPAQEKTLIWNDPRLGIRWPLVDGRPPVLSAKDAAGLPLEAAPCYR